MNTYRITTAKGHSALTEMNDAARDRFIAVNVPAGWTLELVGGSRVTIVGD